MSEKEKQILEKLAEVLPHMDEEDKEILVEKADSMAYMNRKWKKKLSEEEKVNSLLAKGWTFISACQVGTLDAMDIVYVVGATKDVIENESKVKNESSSFHEILNRS